MENKITLKAARINANIKTQDEAGKMLGVSGDTVGNWERGKSFPSAKYIPIIEKVYNIKYHSIIFLHCKDA